MKTYELKLDAKNYEKWKGYILIYTNQLVELHSDLDYAIIRWSSPNQGDSGVFSVRKFLEAVSKTPLRPYVTRTKKAEFRAVRIEDCI